MSNLYSRNFLVFDACVKIELGVFFVVSFSTSCLLEPSFQLSSKNVCIKIQEISQDSLSRVFFINRYVSSTQPFVGDFLILKG